MRCLVTGASGHLGSRLVRLLVDRGEEVIALVRPQSDLWRLDGVLDHVTLIRGELVQIDEIADTIRDAAPQAVVHLAWQGVTSEQRNDLGQIRTNLNGSLALLEVARLAGCRHWIGIGSQAEYGPYEIPLSEDLPTRPQTFYGTCKLCTGLLTQKLCGLYGMTFTWLRLIAIYGPFDDDRHLIPSVIKQLLTDRCPALTPGEQKCDYLYVEDAAEAICQALIHEAGLGIVVLGSGRFWTVRQIIEYIRDQIDPALPLGFGELPYRPDQVMFLQADAGKFSRATGWKPQVDLEEGLDRTIEWHRALL